MSEQGESGGSAAAVQESAGRSRVFLSYDQQDKAAARRLKRTLAGFRLPRSLRGRTTPHGVVPAALGPLFDRETLAADVDLAQRIQQALAEADDLIILCSPHAAANPWLNREIEIFRTLGKGVRIHTVLLAGEPEDAFPPALSPPNSEALVTADLRRGGDGWTDGPLKVIAAALGLPLGALKNGEVARARFRARASGVAALTCAALAVGAGSTAWTAAEELRRAESAGAAALDVVAAIMSDIEQAQETGRISSAAAAAMKDRLERNALLRQAVDGRLQAARAARLEAASAAEEQRYLALNEAGDARLAAGDHDGALTAYDGALEIALRRARDGEDVAWSREVGVSLDRFGDARLAQGDLDGALEAYGEGLAIARSLAARAPADAVFAGDLFVSLTKVGDARFDAGDRDGAVAAYAEGLRLARDLAEQNPADAARRRALVVANVKLAQKAPETAKDRYAEALAVAEDMAAGGVLADDDAWMIEDLKQRLALLS